MSGNRESKIDSDLEQVFCDLKKIMGVYLEVFDIYHDEITLSAHPTEKQLEEIRNSIKALGYAYLNTEEKLIYFIGSEEDYLITETYKRGGKALGLVYMRYDFPLGKSFQLRAVYVDYGFLLLNPIKLF
jgi:hypothetical protein